MKRLIALALLLSLVSVSVGAGRRAMLLAIPKVTDSAPTYLLEENFENTGSPGYDLTWTEASGTPDENYSTTGINMQGSECLELNDGGVNERTDSQTFTESTDLDGYALIRFNTLPAATESFLIVRDGVTAILTLQVSAAGALRVSMPGGNSAVTTSTMSAGTTYSVWWHYTAGSGANGFGSVAFIAETGGSDSRPTSGNNYTQFATSTTTASCENIRLLMDGGIQEWKDRVLVDDATIGSNP